MRYSYIKSLLTKSIGPNYIIDGNHIFTINNYHDIANGKWRHSVIERPEIYPNKIVRAAKILAKLFK